MDPKDREKTSNLVEVALDVETSIDSVLTIFKDQEFEGITLDESYEPILMAAPNEQQQATILIRVFGNEASLEILREHMDIVAIWKDTPISAFEDQNGGF